MLCDDPQLTRFGGNILGRLSAAHGERDGMKEELDYGKKDGNEDKKVSL